MITRRFAAGAAMCVLAALSTMSVDAQAPIAFQERVRAQEAVERVYYEHRIWPKDNPAPKPAFEQSMPEKVLRDKVALYLEESAALDRFWKRPITGDQLQAEMDRMARSTKDPGTLGELFAALGNDPHLIAECLARPILADRLARGWYEREERLASGRSSSRGDGSLDGFEAWLEQFHGDPAPAVRTPGSPYRLPPVCESWGGFSPDSWLPLGDGIPATGCSVVWTGREMIVWGGTRQVAGSPVPVNYGNAYDPATAAWRPVSRIGAPSSREGHMAVWTGQFMIVWGGNAVDESHAWRYDPDTDTWSRGAAAFAYSDWVAYGAAVWTGTHMIVCGGVHSPPYEVSPYSLLYNPASDTWLSGGGGGRWKHTAVWTGTELIVWGGYSNLGGDLAGGGVRYNPSTGQVTSVSPTGPEARAGHSAVWTGSRMIVWGGEGLIGTLNSGGAYDPSTDTWTPTSTADPCPTPRTLHSAVWSGSEMIVWGGAWGIDSGGRYDPAKDDGSQNPWTATPTDGAPAGRHGHSALWTGTEMWIWGGGEPDGGRFNPLSPPDQAWHTIPGTPPSSSPAGRTGHSTVWTGAEMIIWGGAMNMTPGETYTGGRYVPATDAWTETSSTGVPAARLNHTAVWTGTEMIVWGGEVNVPCDSSWRLQCLKTGGRYNPATDLWATTQSDDAPSERALHTAVWTGAGMIVWGGYRGTDASCNPTGVLDDGKRYDPDKDDGYQNPWTAMSSGGAPTSRCAHVALWTGSKMLVWGGTNLPPESSFLRTVYGDGGVYTPGSGWTTLQATGAPQGRFQASAVWAGTEMIVWGGRAGTLGELRYNTGGRYNPGTDQWVATPTAEGCPTARGGHGAVWTGTEMLVWGGEYNSVYFNDGGRYVPSADAWSPMAIDQAPSERWGHSCAWTGEALLVWSGGPGSGPATYYSDGGIFYPNTSPVAHASLSTSYGGDAEFTLGLTPSETLALDGRASTTGNNPHTSVPNEDGWDALTYEWDLNGDAGYGADCAGATVGADCAGAQPAPVTEAQLGQLGVATPGSHTLWLRVKDKVGLTSCASLPLTVRDGQSPTCSMVSPNGGESWDYSPDGDHPKTHLIVWNASDNFPPLKRVKLSYTTKVAPLEADWTCIADTLTPGGGCPAGLLTTASTSFNWTLPTQAAAASAGQVFPSASAKVRVQVWDTSDNPAQAASQGTFYIIQPTAGAIRTLIVTHTDRLPGAGAVYSDLVRLAAHDKVNGAILDLKTVGALSDPATGLYHLWDLDSLNVAKANAVADAIRSYLLSQIDAMYKNAQYVVLVGDDRVIPFHRVPDATLTYPETQYAGQVNQTTPVGKAIALNYYLTDETYGDLAFDYPLAGSPLRFLALPDLSVGRLVESSGQIIGTIDTFLAQNGQVTLNEALVTGYDFLEDSASNIATSYTAAGKTVDTRIGSGWIPSELDSDLFTPPVHVLNNLNDHSDHYSFGTPAGPLTAAQMDAHAERPLEGTLFYNVGCHSGLNVPSSFAQPLDLPELMLQKGAAAYLGNTGFGWGLRYGVGYSERLMELITARLLAQPSITLGDAVRLAKQDYFLQNHRYDVFDEKALMESALYGLPMVEVVVNPSAVGAARELEGPDGPDAQEVNGVRLKKQVGPPEAEGERPQEVTVIFDFTGLHVPHTVPSGKYYTLNGVTSGEIGDALQPMFTYDSRLSGTTNHGSLFADGAFTTEGSFNPVVAAPASSNEPLGEGPIGPPGGCMIPTITRTQVAGGSSFAGAESGATTLSRLTVYTGYYDSGTESLFSGMTVVMFYSNSPDFDPPDVTDPGGDGFHALSGLTATFSVEASDPSGVYRVVVVYNDGQGRWRSFDLAYDEGSLRWEGSLALHRSIVYHVQAVDKAGNVGSLTLTGGDLDGQHQPTGSTWAGPKTFEITLADWDRDGMPDAWESAHGLNPALNDAAGDPDLDGFLNLEEFDAGTDPQNPDSDGDGDNDGSEAHHGREPLSASDGKRNTIMLSKSGSSVQVDWQPGTGDNGAIDGPYWVYRSPALPFTPSSCIVGTPLPTGAQTYTDAGSAGCSPCFYEVRNVPVTLAPQVNVVYPDSGPVAGGTNVSLYGANFAAGAAVKFGSRSATNAVVINATTLTCATPAGLTTGPVDVTVTNTDGKSGAKGGGFAYY